VVLREQEREERGVGGDRGERELVGESGEQRRGESREETVTVRERGRRREGERERGGVTREGGQGEMEEKRSG
jgi:hypothetical protein